MCVCVCVSGTDVNVLIVLAARVNVVWKIKLLQPLSRLQFWVSTARCHVSHFSYSLLIQTFVLCCVLIFHSWLFVFFAVYTSW